MHAPFSMGEVLEADLHCSFIGVLFVCTRNILRNQQKAIIVYNIAVVTRSEKAEDTLGIMIAQFGAGR